MKGQTVRTAKSILQRIEVAVKSDEPRKPGTRLNLDRGLLASTGKPIRLSNQQIYKLIEFP